MNNINSFNNANLYILPPIPDQTPLHSACESGNLQLVESLLKNKAPINAKNSLGKSPLQIACKKNYPEIVELLLSRGANPNVEYAEGITLLLAMCSSGNLKIVELLLKYHADPTLIPSKPKQPITPLYVACLSGNYEMAKILLQYKVPPIIMKLSIYAACTKGHLEILRLLFEKDGYKNINLPVKDDLTILMIACLNGQPEVVKFLLDKGANVYAENLSGFAPIHFACKAKRLEVVELLLAHDIKQIDIPTSRDQTTPLMAACKKNSPAIVKLLLEKGASKKLYDVYGYSAIHIACMSGSLDAVSELLENDDEGYIDFLDEQGNTPLNLAVAYNNKETVKFLIDKKANINLKDPYDYNAFHIACEEGHLEIVKELLSVFKDPLNQKTPEGDTPLLIACANDREELVEFLIDCGGNIDATDYNGFNTFHFACQNGWISIVEKILNNKKKYLNIDLKTLQGDTPLILACQQGEKEIVELLLEHGADITTRNADDNSLLMIACRRSDQEMIKLLLDRKANFELKDKTGCTLLHWACRLGNEEIFELLIQLKANMDVIDLNGLTALHWACCGGNVKIVKRLLEKEPLKILNARTKDATTPFMLACLHNRQPVIELLLSLGADKDLVNLKGYKAFHHACEGGNLELVEMFLKENPNEIHVKTQTGLTPLMIACKTGNPKMVDWLLKNQADVAALSGSKDTALHFACSRSKEIVELLYAHQADLNAENLNKETPLHIACEHNQFLTVKFLLEKSALVNCKTVFGDLPIHIAVSNNNFDLTALLIQHGADVRSPDSNGRTCLMHACKNGNMPLVKLLLHKDAEINAQDHQKKTPLKMAVENKRKDIVQLLLDRGADATDVDLSSIFEFLPPVDLGMEMDLRHGNG